MFATGPNEFQVPGDALWLGSLDDNISRTVAADLGRILGSPNVRKSSGPSFNPRYRVALDIRRFYGISGQDAILDLSWRFKTARAAKCFRGMVPFFVSRSSATVTARSSRPRAASSGNAPRRLPQSGRRAERARSASGKVWLPKALFHAAGKL